MTDPACMEENVQKDGTAIFATALKQAFLEPHVEMVIKTLHIRMHEKICKPPLKKVLRTFEVVCRSLLIYI